MRAVECRDTKLSVVSVPEPSPGEGQILLRTLRCGICGSDLHARTHAEELSKVAAEVGYPSAMTRGDAVVFGHEFCGEVIAYGPRTRRAWGTGTKVVAMPVLRRDRDVRLIGFDPLAPGAYAEQVVVQEAFTFAVPDGVDADTAVFTEPLAVAWHAVRRGQLRRSRPAVVIGCGPIGLAVILMLKAAGVRSVIASDLSPGRRDLAGRCGADVVVDPSAESPWAACGTSGPVSSLPDYLGFGMDMTSRLRSVPLLPWSRLMRLAETFGAVPSGPVVFECVGVPGMVESIVTGAPLHTRVVVVGVCMEPDTFRPAMALHKEMELRFAFGYDPAEFQQVLQMIAGGKVDPSPLRTGTVGLEGVEMAFAALGEPERHAKIVIDPASDLREA